MDRARLFLKRGLLAVGLLIVPTYLFAQGPYSAQIQQALQAFVQQVHTWTATQTFSSIVVNGSCTGCGGGGGTPGGSTTQLQYNNAGSFGGISGATTDGTTLTLVAPVIGDATGTSLANAATYGSELAPAITSGNFTVGSGWAVVSGGVLNKSSDGTGTAAPTAALSITAGTAYKITITLSAATVGSASYAIGGTTGPSTLSAATTYTDYLVARTTGNLAITPTNTSRLTISGISVKALSSGGSLTLDGVLTARNLPIGSTIESGTLLPIYGLPYVNNLGALVSDPFFGYNPCGGSNCASGGRIYLGFAPGAAPTSAGVIIGNRAAGATTELIPGRLVSRGSADLNIGSTAIGLFTVVEGVSGVKLQPVAGADVSITNGAHLLSAGTAPTLTSGFGTGESISGTDLSGKVTVGSGGDTSGVITFARSWTAAPACWAQDETTSNLMRATTTTTTLTITGTMVAADVISYGCAR